MADQETPVKKGGLGSKLHGLFFEEEPAAETAGEEAPRAPTAPRTQTASGTASAPRTRPGTADPKIRQTLERALEPAAQPALSALQKFMRKLEKSTPNAEQRLTAALALIEGEADPRQILVDIDEALIALSEQETKATDAAQEARREQVGGTERQIRANEARLQEIAEEERQLRADIARQQTEMAAAASEIDTTLAGIAATAATMRQELTELKSNVQRKGSK